jgi:putative FmdB family regulatory protein
MPLYEYQCKQCGHRFERIQSFSAEDVKECPVCQGAVERLISTPARPQFKGSGFYTTDYAAPAKSDSGSGSAATSKSNGGSDSGSADKGTAATKTESTATPAASTSSAKSE